MNTDREWLRVDPIVAGLKLEKNVNEKIEALSTEVMAYVMSKALELPSLTEYHAFLKNLMDSVEEELSAASERV